MIRRPRAASRSGAAAVEFALAMNFVLVPMMIGLWETGRLITVQQIVANAAREGARLASQAVTIDQNGNRTEIVTAISPTDNTLNQPNVKAAVYQTLHGAGLTQLTWSDVTVSFAFIDPPFKADPYLGVKGQRFTVSVSINNTAYRKLRWSSFGLIDPAKVSFIVEWAILSDDPFNINTTISNL